MALTKCPECGRDVSDKAAMCPHCGYPISGQQGIPQTIQVKPSGVSIAAFVLAALSVITFFGGMPGLYVAIVFVPISLVLILIDYRSKGSHAFSIVALIIDILLAAAIGILYLAGTGIL